MYSNSSVEKQIHGVGKQVFKFPSKFLLFYDSLCVEKYISCRPIKVEVKSWFDFTSGYIGNIICCEMTHSMT